MNTRPDELSDNETEMLEAMKAEPAAEEEIVVVDEETEAEEQEAAAEETTETTAERDEKGRFKPKVEKDEKPSPLVPIQALDSERGKRQESEASNAELRRELEELRQMVRERAEPQQETTVEMPDPVVDPDGFRAAVNERLEKQAQPLNQLRELAVQQHQMQERDNKLFQYAKAHEQHFRTEYPDKDYDGALNFARSKYAENLKLLGYQDHELPAVISQQEREITALATQRGINPAAYVYNYAVSQGFEAQAKAETEPGNITRLADAQKRTQSTAGASGAPRNEELSFERLATMSEGELAKLEETDPEAFKRALGG